MTWTTYNAGNRWLTKFIRTAAGIEESIATAFGRLGGHIAQHALRTIIIVLVCSMIGGASMQFGREETDAEQIWAPDGSESQLDREFIERTFELSELDQILLTTKSRNTNVLTADAVRFLFETVKMVQDHEVEYAGQLQTYHSLCKMRPSTTQCEVRGILRFWDGNLDAFEADVCPGNVCSDDILLERVNARLFPDGSPVNVDSIFGGYTLQNGNVTTARAIVASLVMKIDDDDLRKELEAWEEGAIALIDEQNAGRTEEELLYHFSRSLGDGLSGAIDADLMLLAGGFVLMFAYVALTLGKRHAIESKVILGLTGIVGVMLAIATAFGVTKALGVPFVPPVQSIPYIILGVGVDDMFIIVNSVQHILGSDGASQLSEREVLTKAMKRCGVTVTITSLTDCIAFLLGTSTTVLAIRYFCAYAAMAVLVDYLYQITFFVAWVTVDLRRARQNRRDCLPCWRVQVPEEDVEDGEEKLELEKVKRSQHDGVIRTFLSTKYAPWLLRRTVRWTILVFTAAMVGGLLYSSTQWEYGLELEDLAPDDHYVQDWFDTYDHFYESSRAPAELYVARTSGGLVNYTNPLVRSSIHEATRALQSSPYVGTFSAQEPYDSWLETFEAYLNGTGQSADLDDAVLFRQQLAAFLSQAEFSRYGDDIVFTTGFASNGTISASRIRFLLTGTSSSGTRLAAMNSVRDAIAPSNDDDEMFMYAPWFIFMEVYNVIWSQLLLNLGLTVIAVFLISSVLLVHPGTAVLVTMNVILVDICLLGLANIWNTKLNSISVTNMVMAIGFAMDYSAHIAHAFQLTPGTRTQRITEALRDVGTSVLSGGTTTLIGALPLALADSEIFRVFFRLIFGVIVFGLYFGLVVLPILLYYFGPSPESTEHEGDTPVELSKKVVDEEASESGERSEQSQNADGESSEEEELAVLRQKVDEET